MANNRVWIECTECGRHYPILKYYGSTGWYTKGIKTNALNSWLESHKHERYSTWGEDQFRFRFENETGFVMNTHLETGGKSNDIF